MRTAIVRSLLAAAALSVAACATHGDAESSLRDPWEKVNRATFDFNIKMDDAIGKPVAMAYREVLPKPVRDGIRHFTDNLNSPVTLVNDLLQGEFARAQVTLVRFLVNTTIGISGVKDAAGEAGLPGHKEDFGQTLAVWGVGPGPYLVVPFLGPHTSRHLGGRVADLGFDPVGYLLTAGDIEWVGIIVTAIDVVDQRERLLEAVDGLRKTSLDFYAVARSTYWQSRIAEIHNGKVLTAVPGDDDIDIDDEDDEPEAAPGSASPKPCGDDSRRAAKSQ